MVRGRRSSCGAEELEQGLSIPADRYV
ncbi:MAG: hypothetical protein QOE95_2223, partial [Gaiellaceae bacterium]|nr:hypothetical protein [Gaiellaceae bacterium]